MKTVSRWPGFFLFAVFAVSVLAFSAHAQTQAASGLRLIKISVTGLRQFNEAQVVAASKLFLGETVTLQDLNAAANRLAQYGVFQNVTYRYRTQNNEMDLEFDVVEAQELVACQFDNLVWFTPAELTAQITHDVPLYNGSVPPSGQMLQDINDSLTAMLKQKGVPGNVQSVPFSPALGQPITAIVFSVSAVALPIREIHFPGASAIAETELQKNAKALLGQNYTATEVDAFVSRALLPLYGELGYLRAHFDAPQPQLLAANPSAPSQDVSLIVPVKEGVSYMWKGGNWSGNRVFSADALNKLLGMQAEGVANMQKFDDGIQAVHDAYLKQGYLQVAVSPQPSLDNATRHVSYQFSVNEGPQFHVGAVTVTGLPDALKQRLLKAWKLQPGDVYDGTYLPQFAKQALPGLYRSGVRVGTPQFSVHADPDTNIVNVEVDFH
ncbi:MAG: POTRA domain-containing protein [Candidatus Acidiferrales bacterium]